MAKATELLTGVLLVNLGTPDSPETPDASAAPRPALIRDLLERRVRSGQGTAEEARLVEAACAQMDDRACVAEIRAKYEGGP